MAEQESPPETNKVEISGKLDIEGFRGLYGQIPIQLNLHKDLSEGILSLLKNLSSRGVDTRVFPCKGATNTLDEVTVIASVRDNYLRVRCPRLQEELRYINPRFEGEESIREHYLSFCYGGDLKGKIPVVKEEEFAANNLFQCPYTKSK